MSSAEPMISEFFNCGMAALERADLPAAEEAFQRCVELTPESADAWCYLGITLASKEFVRAGQALDRALSLDPNHHGALYWRAEVEWVEGNPAAAAKLLKHLNVLVPDSTTNLARLGLAYLSAGETELGFDALQQAVDAGGGLASVSACQSELRRAIYLDLLNRHEDADQLVRRVNGAGVLREVPTARYPRELEDQRCALENVVAGRDILILGSGPSLEQLPPLLLELGVSGCERLCFFAFNNVPVAESMLQQTIGRGVDLACMTSASVIELHSAWVKKFLQRASPPNLFLTLSNALLDGSAEAAMAARWPEKMFYFAANGDYPPIPEDPLHLPPVNSLMCVLPLAVLAQPRRIFLFGCDGAAPSAFHSETPVYFRQGSAEYGDQPPPPGAAYAKWLARDTLFFNALIPTVLKCLSVLHRVQVPAIYICNPSSAYRPFPRISGHEFSRLQSTSITVDFFPARFSQMQRRIDNLQAQLTQDKDDAQRHRIEELQKDVAVLRNQMATIKRFTAPLQALRRLFSS